MSVQFWILMLLTNLIVNYINTSNGDQSDCLFTTDQPNDCESNRDCVNWHSKGPLNQYQHCVWYINPDNQRSKNVCCSKNYAVLAKSTSRNGKKAGDTCPDMCPLMFDPVCGSDGVTYSNSCFLGIEACKDPNSTLFLAYKGVCSKPKVVDTLDISSIMSIKCHIYRKRICNKKLYQPVCGSNGRTYENLCFLKKAVCKDRTIKMVKKEKCGGNIIYFKK